MLILTSLPLVSIILMRIEYYPNLRQDFSNLPAISVSLQANAVDLHNDFASALTFVALTYGHKWSRYIHTHTNIYMCVYHCPYGVGKFLASLVSTPNLSK